MLSVVDQDRTETLLSTSEVASIFKLGMTQISNWRGRGYIRIDPETGERERVFLTPAARDGAGRPMYRWIDVARAEQATRRRAGRKYPSAIAA